MRPVKPCFQNGHISVLQVERSLVGLEAESSVEMYLDVFQPSGGPSEPGSPKSLVSCGQGRFTRCRSVARGAFLTRMKSATREMSTMRWLICDEKDHMNPRAYLVDCRCLDGLLFEYPRDWTPVIP
jgi:hypothetical protein